MIGHNVRVRLCLPEETVQGELRKETPEGVWIYHGFMEQAKLRFYPMHRIMQIEDNGYVSR